MNLLEEDIKYEMVVYWSEEDEAYVVEVPELPSCIWIETAMELGREIPKPKGRLI